MGSSNAKSLRVRDRSSMAATTQDSASLSFVTAGQTISTTGIIRNDVSLGAAAVLTEPAGGTLTIFGTMAGPGAGVGTLEIAADATLYAAGPVGATVLASFAGAGGTLELAGLFLPEMSASIAGFSVGDVIDIVSGTVTDAALAFAGSSGSITLGNETSSVAVLTFSDAAAEGDSVFAIPDPIDGTRILLGSAIPAVISSAPQGSAQGAVFSWSGSPGGQWADAALWRSAGGGQASIAPGARDTVDVAGPSNAVLVVAGNAVAATLETTGLLALVGSFHVGTLIAGIGSQDALVLTAGSQLTTSTATVAGGVLQVAAVGAVLNSPDLVVLRGGTLWVADGATAETQGLTLTGGSVRIGAEGTVCVGGTIGAAGTLSIAAGATLSGYGALYAPIDNGGTLSVHGVTEVFGVLSGSGFAQVWQDSELYLPYGADSGQQLEFETAPGTIELFGSASTCAATIKGFGLGDVVDIASGTVSQATWLPGLPGLAGTLDLGQAGTLAVELGPGLNPSDTAFSVSADGLGGTMIEVVPCFCSGTRLARPGGSVAVEDIAVGDRLLTRSGAARPVRWIGRRHYDADTLRREPQLRPVRIRAGALGPGRPAHDVRLSPQHAVAFPTPAGVRLVPAIALVDDRSVLRESPATGCTYHHVELDSHDLLLAEGLMVESFTASGPDQRSIFQVATGKAQPETALFAPRLEQGPILIHLLEELGLTAVRLRGKTRRNQGRFMGNLDRVNRTARRLEVEGWALMSDRSVGPLWLDIALNGMIMTRVVANQWRPDLDRAGIAGGRCGFRIAIPSLPSGLTGRAVVEVRPRQPTLRDALA